MDPITSIYVMSAMVALAAVCATCYKARAAPKLAFAGIFDGKSPDPHTLCNHEENQAVPPGNERGEMPCSQQHANLVPMEDCSSIVPVHSQRYRIFQVMPMGGHRRKGITEEQKLRLCLQGFALKAGAVARIRNNGSEVDDADGQYADGFDEYEKAKGPRLARVKKPFGADHDLYEDLVRAFSNCGSRDHALVFKATFNSRFPGHRGLIKKAFHEACKEVEHLA